MNYKYKYLKYKQKYTFLKRNLSNDKNSKINSINKYIPNLTRLTNFYEERIVRYWKNIYNFIYILTVKNKTIKNLLHIPRFYTQQKILYSNKLYRNITAIDIKTNRGNINKIENYFLDFYFPTSLVKKFKTSKKRFSFFTLLINYKIISGNFVHSNLIIIDYKKKTFERFDPLKFTLHDNLPNSINKGIYKNIDIILNKIIKNKIGLDFKFISTDIIYGKLKGIQYFTDKYPETKDFCNVINILYLHMKLLNPNIKQNDIISYLLKLKNNELIDLIYNYSIYIENVLNDNKDIINELDNEQFFLSKNLEKYDNFLQNN
jgi:hypothetical protein